MSDHPAICTYSSKQGRFMIEPLESHYPRVTAMSASHDIPHLVPPPQGLQPDTFIFAPQDVQYEQQQQPPQPQPQPPQPQPQQQRQVRKTFVFVDEHNRHKRLKVMRACEGCRRRKIKCDAASTNTWPCSACVRLRLSCVRPNGFDENDTTVYEPPESESFSPAAAHDGFRPVPPPQLPSHHLTDAPKTALYPGQTDYLDAAFRTIVFPDQSHGQPQQPQQQPQQQQHEMHYTTIPPPPVSLPDHHHHHQYYESRGLFVDQPLHPEPAEMAAPSPDSSSGQELMELLGSLNVNEAGTAPYLRNKPSLLRGQPVAEQEDEDEDEDEEDFAPPPLPVARGPGSKIRIPPELMPDQETALRYFDMFFTHVHPYIPVLSKTLFYRQWSASQNTVSPLILEAIFAIGGRLADEPAQGQQWLALATSHADAFMDVPRLSTLQACLLLLKAREAAPQRGYYYRSWMSVVQCVQMGKELGLDEHLSDHQAGRNCGSTVAECQMKTRIWQAVFALETMTGAPQGRTDLSCRLDTVDFDLPTAASADDPDFSVSRDFTYLVRIIRNVSRMNSVYARIKKKPDWGLDPDFADLNPMFNSWLGQLPAHLTIALPPDGVTAPWVASPFSANLLAYYHLTLVLLHRPQLTFVDPVADAAQWKSHMVICYESAKAICRLQEGVLNAHGLAGLQCMLRGFSFTIYAALSCIVLHLVAMTAPDPDLNKDSGEYFTRHMRLIEKVMVVWAMPELQRQVDAVREAFSVDTSQPFALRPTFPCGSPRSSHDSASPPPPGQATAAYQLLPPPPPPPASLAGSKLFDYQGFKVDPYMHHPITPPISARPIKISNSPTINSLVMMSQGTRQQAPAMTQALSLGDQSGWNPTPIFKQWSTSFSPPSDLSPPQLSPRRASQMGYVDSSASQQRQQHEHQQQQHQQQQQQQHALQAIGSAIPAGPGSISPTEFASMVQMPYVTPAMWQESVQSVYASGMKRTWGEFEGGGLHDG